MRRLIGICVTLFFMTIICSTAQADLQKKISLDFKDTDVRQIYKVIAQTIDMGIVCQKSIRGQVTLNLKDVSAEDALDMVSDSSGFTWFQKGNTIVVTYGKMLPAKTKVIKLKYIGVDDAIKILFSVIKKDIKAASDEENGTLVIYGIEEVLKSAEKILSEIDQPREFVKGKIKVLQGKKSLHEIDFTGKIGGTITIKENLMDKIENGKSCGSSVDMAIRLLKATPNGEYNFAAQIGLNNALDGKEVNRFFEVEFKAEKGGSVEVVKSLGTDPVSVLISIEK